MSFYHARLLDQEGTVWAEIGVPEKQQILRVAVAPKLNYAQMAEEPTAELEIDTIEFQYERTAGDGVLIYRRITPLWRA